MDTIKGAYKQTAADKASEQEYQASDDVRTLHRAHQIKKDPARHGRAKVKMRAHIASLKSLMSGAAPPAGVSKEMPHDELPGI